MGIVSIAVRGVVAGAFAGAAMDLVWYRRYRAGGGGRSFADWEFSTSIDGFDEAPAPAKVGKRIADTFGVELPVSSAGAVNNAVHWATAAGWGKVAALTSAALPVPPLAVGVLTGPSAWATSYAVLGSLGIYEPITSYDRDALVKDLTAHLVFGSVLGLALSCLRVRRR